MQEENAYRVAYVVHKLKLRLGIAAKAEDWLLFDVLLDLHKWNENN